MKKTYLLSGIIGVFLIFKALIYSTGRVFFDEGVYLGMAHYFASWGQAGYFEPIRPLLLPLLLTPVHWLSHPFWGGRVLLLLLTVGCALLIYHLTNQHAGERAALWAMLLFVLSNSIIKFGGLILTDVLVFTLAAYAASLAWRERTFAAGCVLGIAFLLKFPVLLMVAPIGILIVYRYKLQAFRPALFFGAGLAIFVGLYCMFNILMYQGPILDRVTVPLSDASNIVSSDAWMYGEANMSTYLLFLITFETSLLLACLLAWRHYKNGVIIFFAFCALAFFFYFAAWLPRLDTRYMLSVIPFLCVIGGIGLANTIPRKYTILAVSLLLISPILISIHTVQKDHFPTSISIPDDNNLMITNTGQALLYHKGRSELYPGPNFNHMYLQWKLSDNANLLIINPQEYSCNPIDDQCKAKLTSKFERLMASENTYCEKLHGQNIIVLTKHPLFLNATPCQYSSTDTISTTIVRLSGADFTAEGRLDQMENLAITIDTLATRNISALLILTPSQRLDNTSQDFIQNLPTTVQLGVLATDGFEKFVTEFSTVTQKNITIIASPSDDWFGRSPQFPDSITTCVRGNWDTTVMDIPCEEIDLYSVQDWSANTSYNTTHLLASYQALLDLDDHIVIDVPVSSLHDENIELLQEFLSAIH